jgi:uncharacterized protein YlzI (FlbEa/FlbD family)
MLIEPHAIEIIETVVSDDGAAKTGVWISFEDGFVRSAILTDKFGWLTSRLNKDRQRLQLTAVNGAKMSIPADIIRRVIERPDCTVIYTTLRREDGPLNVAVKESVEDIMDLAGLEDPAEPIEYQTELVEPADADTDEVPDEVTFPEAVA